MLVLPLSEQEQRKLDLLPETLSRGEEQLNQGKGLDGEKAFEELLS